jgi:hypothetical protein
MKLSTLSALKIALLYAVVGALWILFSDSLLEALVDDAATLSRLQTLKGWGYVALTAWALYLLIRRSILQLTRVSYHSRLTGLPNRQALEEDLRGSLGDYRRGRHAADAAARSRRFPVGQRFGRLLRRRYPVARLCPAAAGYPAGGWASVSLWGR